MSSTTSGFVALLSSLPTNTRAIDSSIRCLRYSMCFVLAQEMIFGIRNDPTEAQYENFRRNAGNDDHVLTSSSYP